MVIGNWKMFGSKIMVANLIGELLKGLQSIQAKSETDRTEEIKNMPEIVLCPPAVYLQQAQSLLVGSAIKLGAQNSYCEKEGPFTGEISPSMLSDLGCGFVILGHSERRQLFGEDDALIARKCQAAYDAGLIPILCVGETASERAAGKTFEVVSRQLQAVIAVSSNSALNIGKGQGGLLAKLVLAYEPVWAIGTGVTATPDQAEEVHHFLREKVAEHDAVLARCLRILYGGSVKAQNAKALFEQPNIDGGLIGGASLVAKEFLEICKSFR